MKLPAFPAAETHRNRRIKTREAVMSASTKADKALLSSLTNILTGDFARTIDTFKEIEAAKNRYVRARQVLLKMQCTNSSVLTSSMVQPMHFRIFSMSN